MRVSTVMCNKHNDAGGVAVADSVQTEGLKDQDEHNPNLLDLMYPL